MQLQNIKHWLSKHRMHNFLMSTISVANVLLIPQLHMHTRHPVHVARCTQKRVGHARQCWCALCRVGWRWVCRVGRRWPTFTPILVVEVEVHTGDCRRRWRWSRIVVVENDHTGDCRRRWRWSCIVSVSCGITYVTGGGGG